VPTLSHWITYYVHAPKSKKLLAFIKSSLHCSNEFIDFLSNINIRLVVPTLSQWITYYVHAPKSKKLWAFIKSTLHCSNEFIEYESAIVRAVPSEGWEKGQLLSPPPLEKKLKQITGKNSSLHPSYIHTIPILCHSISIVWKLQLVWKLDFQRRSMLFPW
jgi:hypothetical protein